MGAIGIESDPEAERDLFPDPEVGGLLSIPPVRLFSLTVRVRESVGNEKTFVLDALSTPLPLLVGTGMVWFRVILTILWKKV